MNDVVNTNENIENVKTAGVWMMVLGAIYLFWALFDAWALIDALIFLPLGYLAYAKYSKSAKTDHIMPANVPKKKYNEVLKIAEKTHKILGCRGVTRSDFKFFNNKFFLLEINTQPGMTNLSLVPEIANYKKISFEKLIQKIIFDASLNK